MPNPLRRTLKCILNQLCFVLFLHSVVTTASAHIHCTNEQACNILMKLRVSVKSYMEAALEGLAFVARLVPQGESQMLSYVLPPKTPSMCVCRSGLEFSLRSLERRLHTRRASDGKNTSFASLAASWMVCFVLSSGKRSCKVALAGVLVCLPRQNTCSISEKGVAFAKSLRLIGFCCRYRKAAEVFKLANGASLHLLILSTFEMIIDEPDSIALSGKLHPSKFSGIVPT